MPKSSQNGVKFEFQENYGETKNLNQIRHILDENSDINSKRWTTQLRSYTKMKKLK